MVKALRVIIEFHWGYSIKYPMFSASQPSFKFPPPTTLLGALSASLVYCEEATEVFADGDRLYSYAAKILDVAPWVTFRFTGIEDLGFLLETRDLTRTLIAQYVRSDNVYPLSPYVWAVQTHGKIYAPTIALDVVYLAREEATKRIARCAWGITRVGTKESIVSVRSIDILDVKLATGETVETQYSFNRALAEPIAGEYVTSRLPVPDREWFRLGEVRDPSRFMDEFVIPKPGSPVKARVKNGGVALEVEGVGGIVAPRGVASYS